MKFPKLINQLLATKVYAHCDIPCGIYEIDTMKHSARTVAVMVAGLKALNPPPISDQASWVEYQNKMARMVANKEAHAHIVKQQLLILWTDYFKPDNSPDGLHDKIWAAAKLCSRAKQTVDVTVAKQLEEAVAEIAALFVAAEAAKAAKTQAA